MGCKNKISEKEKNELTFRMHEIGLNGFIGHGCLCEQQQDVLLVIQRHIPMFKELYIAEASVESNHPYDEYIAAKKKLNDLKKYCRQTVSMDNDFGTGLLNCELLNAVDLQKPTRRAGTHKKEFKKFAQEKMTADIFSKHRKAECLRNLLIYFDEYEVTEDDLSAPYHTKIELPKFFD